MRYTYKVLEYYPHFSKNNQEAYVENKINQMAANGWEYVNCIATGTHNFALLVFRKVI